MEEQLKILVVDDAQENVVLLAKFIAKMGHTPVLAYNGVQAVQVFESENPDIVLMDVMMPEMDGYEATARIKAICGSRWVPVIFLSALGQEASLVKGLEVGGDDYLTKPINLVVLQAKIRAMQRIAKLQREVTDKASELAGYYARNEEEKRISTYIMDHIVGSEGLQDDLLDYWISPAAEFSGDLVAAARTPGKTLHIMLADGTGHGLSAALNVLPLTQTFYSMTDKGFPLASIAEELNDKINSLMPVDRFVATTMVAINTREKTIEIWNGGNPPPFLLNQAGECIYTCATSHLPIGILKRGDFDSRTETYLWNAPGQLFFCSDGLLEAENPRGEAYGQAHMHEVLAAAPAERRFPALLDSLSSHLGGLSAHDDVSIVMATIPLEENIDVTETEGKDIQDQTYCDVDAWRFDISFGAEQLKYIDTVPVVMSMVERVKEIQAHVSPLFLILSELFNNALDHGLLHLDSSIKHLPGGFEQFLTMREERLAALNSGHVDLSFTHAHLDGRLMLKIVVRDSGPGFNYQDLLNASLDASTKMHGRGIALVRSLCNKVEYFGKGNEVMAYFPL